MDAHIYLKTRKTESNALIYTKHLTEISENKSDRVFRESRRFMQLSKYYRELVPAKHFRSINIGLNI